MNKKMMTVLLPLVLIPAVTSSRAAPYIPQATVFSFSKGAVLNQQALYTESNWERVLIPQDVVSRLGGLGTLNLSVAGLPANVIVRMNGGVENNQNNASSIGMNVTRLNTTNAVNALATFTLTNLSSRESYSFTAKVIGPIR